MTARPADAWRRCERVRTFWTSPRVVLRYLLFQVPGWAAVVAAAAVGSRWLDLPLWAWIAGPLAWVVKDLFLLPLVWQAYSNEPSRLVGEGALIGASGLARARLAPYGYVRVGSELWRAELEAGESPVPEGARGHGCGVRGLTLRGRGERGDQAMPERKPGSPGGVSENAGAA